MKALKCWGWILFVISIICFLIGFVGGEFNKIGGLYGSSMEAMMLTVFQVVCFLLAVTIWLVVYALKEKQESKE